MTMKYNAKFEGELTFHFKTDMRNSTNFDSITRISKKITLWLPFNYFKIYPKITLSLLFNYPFNYSKNYPF